MDRRSFLQTLGASLMTPLLIGPRTARAQAAPRARRLVLFFSPNGTIHRHWRPTGAGANYDFPAGSILEPLRAHRERLLVLDGLDFVGASNHEGGMSAMLTGGGGGSSVNQGASIDQYLARQIGAMDRFPSLELSVQTTAWGGSTQTRMVYRRAGELVAPSDDPREVHRRLFGDVAGSAQTVRAARRRSVLDVVKGDLAALERRLAGDERDKLAAHVESLRQMEASLAAAPASQSGCATPTQPTGESQSNDSFPATTRAQIELMVTALACNMTRIASLQLSHTVSPTVPSWLSLREGHHALSHMDDSNTAGVQAFVTAERWFAEQFALLIERLQSLPEPGAEGSMLDHSLVIWTKEMGDSRLHDCLSVPFVVAGGGGGTIRPGRLLKFDHVPHTRLWVSVAQAMGVMTDEFGSGGPNGRGPLPGLVG